jgi:putative ABC transport system substrate-binding protein
MDPAAVHAPFAAAFLQGLRENSYIESQNVTILWRYAGNDASVLPGLVSDLIGLRVDILVADGTQAALAAKRATSSIPIVVPASSDLARAGLVASLARPGGNVTGLTTLSTGLTGKRLALLKEMVPRIRRVAVLVNPENPGGVFQLEEAQAAAPSLALEVQSTAIRGPDDIERVIPSLAGRVDALLLTDDFVLDGYRARIGTLAAQNRLPAICGYTIADDKSCLMWYGPDLLKMFRRSAHYVAQILGGRKPGDLPVEQPVTFALILNAKTASALGITIPQSLRLAADDIIR